MLNDFLTGAGAAIILTIGALFGGLAVHQYERTSPSPVITSGLFEGRGTLTLGCSLWDDPQIGAHE